MTYRHFNNETTRSSVIKAVADTGNDAAWARFFDLYAGFVFSIARSKGLKEEDADDIVQIVFADLARTIPTFKYDRAKGKFRSYLIGLVHWRVKDKLRLVQRDKELKENFFEEAANLPPADKDFAERDGSRQQWRRHFAVSSPRCVRNTTRRLSPARLKGRTRKRSCGFTISPATISIRFASD